MILVLDIDNTIADCSHRLHLIKDGKSVEDLRRFMAVEEVAKDLPFPKAQEALNLIRHQISQLIIVTGRNEYLREVTENWLKEHFLLDSKDYILIMRPTGELSPATEHKIGRLEKVLSTLYDEYYPMLPVVAIDDDPYVLHEYSRLSITLRAPECWDLLVHKKPDKKEPLFGK